MPITRIFWSGNTGRDIHVLRNNTPTRALNQQALRFRPLHGPDVFAELYTGGDVTLTFTPLFKGAPQGNNFVGDNNGITVDMHTGVVTVSNLAQPNVKHNFLIEVSALNAGDDPSKTLYESIRVQVHNSVTQVWLTPDKLTVRPTDDPAVPTPTPCRFSVRAQFDDGLVGDLTQGHGVSWSDAGGHVDPNTGEITVLASDIPDSNTFVTATLPAQLGGAATPLGPTLHIAAAFSKQPSPPKLSIVPGGGLPSAATVENAANILLVSDGFRAGDEDSFNRIVNSLVHFLKTNQLVKPYNVLSGRMNFWKLFIPADDAGISVRGEVTTYQRTDASGTHTFAQPVPAVARPPADPPAPKPPIQWQLPHLLYAAGLPFPGDETPARTPATLKIEWGKLLQHDPTPNLTGDDVVNAWKKLARRTLVEDRNDFPGLSLGFGPTSSERDTSFIRLHPERVGLVLLQEVLATLGSDDMTLSDGRRVGVLWHENTFRFDNRNFLVLISALPGGRAGNQPTGIGRFVALNSANATEFRVKSVPGSNAFALDVDTVPTDAQADIARTFGHELGHSLGLGDEYVEVPLAFNRPSADPTHANLESQSDAQIPDPNDATKKILSGDQISWVWHRIVAAAVVNGAITPDVGLDTFRIPVEPDVSFRFAKDDQLLLRLRTWGQPLHKYGPTDISGTLIVIESPQPDSILVRSTTTALSAQRFPAGSLLYKAKPAPASVLSIAYPFAEMVAKNIKEAISANRRALVEIPGDNRLPQIPAVDTEDGRTPVDNIKIDPDDLPRIVGLYAGGDTFISGIFHPTGQCMMRNDDDAKAEFCAVCRYVMVDMIAPEFHPEIDTDYDKIYPQG